jgi:hypothetical protein
MRSPFFRDIDMEPRNQVLWLTSCGMQLPEVVDNIKLVNR